MFHYLTNQPVSSFWGYTTGNLIRCRTLWWQEMRKYELFCILNQSNERIAFYYIHFMPKSRSPTNRRVKNIKNVYIQKINSLFKVTGVDLSSLSCLNNGRRTISSQSPEGWVRQRKENNKDAARKARERKKIYMQLLEKAVENLQKLNKEGDEILKSSTKILHQLNKENECKGEDEIDQYLMNIQNQKAVKECSLATMDLERECQLNKIVNQISKISVPYQNDLSKLQATKKTIHFSNTLKKIKQINEQLPEMMTELKSVCSEHTSLHVMSVSSKSQNFYDPYIGKTLKEQYYSQTLCRKDIKSIETVKLIQILSSIESYCNRVEQSVQ